MQIRDSEVDAFRPDILVGHGYLDPKSPLTRKVPIDAAAGIDEARHVLTQSSLQGRSPWNQGKAKSIIDHRKATRCEIEAPAINAGCGVTFCEGPM